MHKITANVTIGKPTHPSFMRFKPTKRLTEDLKDLVEGFELTPEDVVTVVVGRNQLDDSDLIHWKDDGVHGKLTIGDVTITIFDANVHMKEVLLFIARLPKVDCEISGE